MNVFYSPVESEQLTYITLLLMIWGSLLCRRGTNFTPPPRQLPEKEGLYLMKFTGGPTLKDLQATGDILPSPGSEDSRESAAFQTYSHGKT